MFAENILTENKLSNKLLIGIQAVSFPTKAYRDWPTECFLELCKKIIDKYPEIKESFNQYVNDYLNVKDMFFIDG